MFTSEIRLTIGSLVTYNDKEMIIEYIELMPNGVNDHTLVCCIKAKYINGQGRVVATADKFQVPVEKYK